MTFATTVKATGVIAVAALFNACGGDSETSAQSPIRAFTSAAVESPEAAALSTINSPLSVDYVGDMKNAGFKLEGFIVADESIRGDSLVRPNNDTNVCKQFRDQFMPRDDDGVGGAIVWLSGVKRGKPNNLRMRASARLNDCRLEPRVQIVRQGATVMLGSHDAVESKLRVFETEVGSLSDPRALVPLFDFGQVVPVPNIAREPGILEVRDDLHPWVRGFIAVVGHPYIAITDKTGRFVMDSVPSGEYEIIVFSEALGIKRETIRVPLDSTILLRLEKKSQ